ncbi:hypothetical protein D3C72_1102300 [compost metagenome]
MKAGVHSSLLQRVGNGHHRHALMMGHEVLHDGNPLIVGQPRPGEVQRLVKAVTSSSSLRGQPLEILQCRAGVDHGRQRGGVGGYHAIFRQPTLEGQARNTKVGVLIGELQVPGVVSRLGYAPWNAKRTAIADLQRDDQAVGLLQL